MDTKKIKNFVVPFLITLTAVVAGLAVNNYIQKRWAKKAIAASAAPAATTV